MTTELLVGKYLYSLLVVLIKSGDETTAELQNNTSSYTKYCLLLDLILQ